MLQLLEDSGFSTGAASNIYDLISLSQTVQRTHFVIYEFSFTCVKVEYKKPYTEAFKIALPRKTCLYSFQ